MKSYGVIILVKATDQYFAVRLFIALLIVILTFGPIKLLDVSINNGN